jgi:HAD superfamily hydrolase (TIGR01509 family)
MNTPATQIFDLGNVIVAHDNNLLWDRLAMLCPDTDQARSQLPGLVGASKIGTGHEQVGDLHHRLIGELGMRANPDQFLDAWVCHFSAIPGMSEILHNLALQRPLVLLSNTNAAHWDHIRGRFPVLKLFRSRLLSHELGLVKPNNAIFELAARQAGQEIERCFFTDDLQPNVDAAVKCGMDAVLFQGVESLRRALADRGIDA